MKRLSTILGTTFAMWAILAACAAAATLALTSTSLAAGNAAVSSCGISSAAATRNVDNSGNVTQVTVANIPAACSGQTFSVTLKSQTGASLGNASGVLSGCGATCTATFTSFGATVSAASLYGYAFGVTG